MTVPKAIIHHIVSSIGRPDMVGFGTSHGSCASLVSPPSKLRFDFAVPVDFAAAVPVDVGLSVTVGSICGGS